MKENKRNFPFVIGLTSVPLLIFALWIAIFRMDVTATENNRELVDEKTEQVQQPNGVTQSVAEETVAAPSFNPSTLANFVAKKTQGQTWVGLTGVDATGEEQPVPQAETERIVGPEYMMSAIESEEGGMIIRGTNPANNMELEFDERGMVVRAADGSWQAGIRLEVLSGESGSVAMSGAAALARDNEVSYDHGNVREWFVNDENGVEHLFRLMSPPDNPEANRGSGVVRARISFDSNLIPIWNEETGLFDLVDEAGFKVMQYGNLHVFDSMGRKLPAWFELDPTIGDAILLAYNDSEAVYPVTVDPTLSVELVKDINTTEEDHGNPQEIVIMNDIAYFRAYTPDEGWELWRSDGTEEGTYLLNDINAGPSSGSPSQLLVLGNTLYFSANNLTAGTELWKSDGTPEGTVLVKDIYPGSGSSYADLMVHDGSTLYFRANEPTTGEELWKSDGTEAGTVLVSDIISGSGSSSPNEFAIAGGTVYFRAITPSTGWELWKSDGTPEGTVLVKDINPSSGSSTPRYFEAIGNTLYFQAYEPSTGIELWKSDGTSEGTVLVKDISPGPGHSSPQFFGSFGDNLYFNASEPLTGNELWKSDGTTAGTMLVKDINPGTPGSNARDFLAIDDTLYFRAYEQTVGWELWKSDGTSEGTALLKDIYPGPISGSPGYFADMGGVLYFRARDPLTGDELWKSDGTTAGTVLVQDIRIGENSSSPFQLVTAANGIFFNGVGSSGSNILFYSDGTADGAVGIAMLEGTQTSNLGQFLVFNEKAYFSAFTPDYGYELWVSDGTEMGTSIFKDLYPGVKSASPANLTQVGSQFFFSANNPSTGYELWKSDGTAGGTVLVKDIYSGIRSSYLFNFTALGDLLIFTARDSIYGNELWKSDGTLEGTSLLADIYPGNGRFNSNPSELTTYGNFVFFRAFNRTYGWELWKTDGSLTTLVKDINPGRNSSQPAFFTPFNGSLYFRALNPESGHELWRTDGSNAGTVLVQDILSGGIGSNPQNLKVANGSLFFTASDSSNGNELWKTDGSATGAAIVKDIYPGPGSSNPRSYVDINGSLVFVAFEPTTGNEIWKSDGTSVGTQPVLDIADGATSSSPSNLAVFGNEVLFAAYQPETGIELWSSDGTSAGTYLVDDIREGTASSSPNQFIQLGDRVLFSATTGELGRELWSKAIITNTAPVGETDAYQVDEDTVLSIGASNGVLANDSDTDGDVLTVSLDTSTINGTLVLNTDGSFSYSPDLNFHGEDAFTYLVSDGTETVGPVSVSITVNDVNDFPVSAPDGPASAVEGELILLTGSGSSDVDGTIDTYLWDFGDGASASAINAQHVYRDNGIYSVTLTVIDDDGDSTTHTLTVTVANVAPTVEAGDAVSGNEGSAVSLAGSFSDPGTLDTHTFNWDFGDGNSSTELSPSHAYADNGVYTATLTVTDNDGAVGSDSVTVTVVNVAPTAEAGDAVSGNEGSAVSLAGSFSDPGTLDTHTYSWDFGDGNSSTELSPSHAYADNGVYTATLTVTDNDGAVGSDSVTVTVANVAPTGSIIDPLSGIVSPVNQAIPFIAHFFDPGAVNTVNEIIRVEWVFTSLGVETARISATYAEDPAGIGYLVEEPGGLLFETPGIYNITLEVEDKDGGLLSTNQVYEEAIEEFLTAYVVVYDPDGGFVTGGGWVWSPEGAMYPGDPAYTALVGKASFGFVAKYKKGANTPIGNTEFQFQAGNLNFHSESYEWLVVAGSRAQYKGVGSVNGEGDFGFMLTAVDGDLAGSGSDRLRMKIWDRLSGEIIYDNQDNTDDNSYLDEFTILGGGSVVIHEDKHNGKK